MNFLRQQDLIDIQKLQENRFILIGAGGIGSFVAPILCKMGVDKMQIWDKDVIEEHNLPNQNYKLSQQGRIKVEALAENIYEMTGTVINVMNDWWKGDFSFAPNIMILAVDSMDIRNELWPIIKSTAPKGMWLLDARMSSRAMAMYTCRIGNEGSMKLYEEDGIFPSSEADKEPCTAKAIIHTCSACAYMVGNAVHEIIKEGKVSGSYFGELLNFHLVRPNGIVE